jgi:hypothetical protein
VRVLDETEGVRRLAALAGADQGQLALARGLVLEDPPVLDDDLSG